MCQGGRSGSTKVDGNSGYIRAWNVKSSLLEIRQVPDLQEISKLLAVEIVSRTIVGHIDLTCKIWSWCLYGQIGFIVLCIIRSLISYGHVTCDKKISKESYIKRFRDQLKLPGWRRRQYFHSWFCWMISKSQLGTFWLAGL